MFFTIGLLIAVTVPHLIEKRYIIIIPSQWRAKDIIAEINRVGISVKTVLIEHQYRLVDYYQQDVYR